MRGPVEQLGCARRPVKAEVAGSNPVGTARTEATSPGPPGQVAQSVERAAENRKVGGSIPSLPTTSAQVKPSVAPAPLTGPAPDSGILPARPLTTAATGGPPGTLRQRSHHATVEDRHRHSEYLRGDCQGSREPVGLAAPAWWSWSSCSGHESPLTYPILLSGYTLHACSTPTNNAAHNSGPAAGGSSGNTQPHTS